MQWITKVPCLMKGKFTAKIMAYSHCTGMGLRPVQGKGIIGNNGSCSCPCLKPVWTFLHGSILCMSNTRAVWVTIKACLHVLSPSPSPSKYNVVPMVTVHLMGRMGTEPILSVKRSISIDTMINFDVDGDGHGHGDSRCKQALRVEIPYVWTTPYTLLINRWNEYTGSIAFTFPLVPNTHYWINTWR